MTTTHFDNVHCNCVPRLNAEVERLTEKLTSLQEAYLKSAEQDKNLTQALFDSKAEVVRLKEKVSERDQLVKTSNLLANEEGKTLQRWKDWGITKEQQLKRAVEIAEMFSQVKGLHYQCNCAMCQMLASLKADITQPSISENT